MRFSNNVISNKHGYVALNKPAGIPTQEDKSGDQSLHASAECYCKTKLHLLNRLDRPASGLVLMSKKESFTKHYNQLQSDGKLVKTYLAITAKKDVPKEGTLENFLAHNSKVNKAIVTDELEGSKKVQLDYEILSELDNYFFVKINIQSGKFHQIRSQLAHIGLHIKGDVKYGARRKNKDRGIHLHAYHYLVHDPITKKSLELFADVPSDALWDAVKSDIENLKANLS